MKPTLAVLLAALVLGASGCAERPETSASAGPAVQSAPVPGTSAERDPAPTPSTHAGAPVPDAPSTATAKDSPANNPRGELTNAEENTAMPKAGQANNHSSPALDPAKAGPRS